MDRKDFDRYITEHYEEIYNDLFKYSLYFTKNKDEAEDIVQDTFVKAYEYIPGFRNEFKYSLKAWLLKISRSIYLSKVLQRSKINADINQEEIKSSFNLAENIISETEREIFKDVLYDHVFNLPAKIRDIYILSEIYLLPDHKISEVLKIPIGTVKSRLHRGRKILQEKKQIIKSQ